MLVKAGEAPVKATDALLSLTDTSENDVEEMQNTAMEPPMDSEGTAMACDWLLTVVALEAWKEDDDSEVGPLNMTNRAPPTE